MYWGDDRFVKHAPRGWSLVLLIAIVVALAVLLLILSIWH